MSRPVVVRQQDICRLIKGARAAGVTISTIEIDPAGLIRARIGASESEFLSNNDNEWDEVLDLGKTKQSPAERH